MTVRKVKADELRLAMSFIDMAKAHLKNQNIDQWQDGYPDEKSIEADISRDRGYFIIADGKEAGYFCLDFEGESAYDNIEGGWKGEGRYATLHRLAVSDEFRGRGVGKQAFALAEELCTERNVRIIRVDTKSTNPKMRHIIKSMGYTYCGTVFYLVSGKRMAFEKLL